MISNITNIERIVNLDVELRPQSGEDRKNNFDTESVSRKVRTL